MSMHPLVDRVVDAYVSAIDAEVPNLGRRPYFDGLYVTWDELARDPAATGCAPYSYEGAV